MTRRSLISVLAVLLGAAALQSAETEPSDRMVVVASAASPVVTLDAIDLKRLFLGVPVVANGHNLHALLNDSDPRLYVLFLQHVVGMSQSMYERRLLELTMEQGRRMPARYADQAPLIAALIADPTALSIAWASSVQGDPRLREVRELWRE